MLLCRQLQSHITNLLKNSFRTDCLYVSLVTTKSIRNYATAILISSFIFPQYFVTIQLILNERPNKHIAYSKSIPITTFFILAMDSNVALTRDHNCE